MQPDTIVPSPGNPQTFNRYAYTLGNPLKYSDPTGHYSCGDQYDPACFEGLEEKEDYAEMTGDDSILRYVRRHSNVETQTDRLTTIGFSQNWSVGANFVGGISIGGSNTYAFNISSGEIGMIHTKEFNTVLSTDPGVGVSIGNGLFFGYNGNTLGSYAGRDTTDNVEVGLGLSALGDAQLAINGGRAVSLVPGRLSEFQTDSETGRIIQSLNVDVQIGGGVDIKRNLLRPIAYNRSPGTNNSSTVSLVIYPWNWSEYGFINRVQMSDQ